MKNDFHEALLRLKQVLGMQADKEVAEALGMNDRALAARKARGSFPEDKLRLLASRRPELKIDPDYVLTGKPGTGAPAKPAIKSLPPAAQAAVALMEGAAAVAGRAAARGIALDGRASLDLAQVIAAAGQRSDELSDANFEAVVRSYLTGRGEP